MLELLCSAVGRAIEVGEFLPRLDEAGRQRHGLFKGMERIGYPTLFAQAHAEQAVGVGHVVVETHDLVERRQRLVDTALAKPREGQLVADAGRPVVQAEAALVGLGGGGVALQLVQHVSEFLERTCRRRVEVAGCPEVAGGRVQVAAATAALVCLAAAQRSQHGIGTKLDGPAVRLDRGEGLVVLERGISPGEGHAVVPLPGGGLVGRGSSRSGEQQHGEDGKGARHEDRCWNRLQELSRADGV